MSDGNTHREDGRHAFVQFYWWVFGIGYERNVGGPERTIRYTVGALSVIAGIGILASSVVGSPLTTPIIALALIVTGLYLIYEALVQYCPLNHTLDRNTYPRE